MKFPEVPNATANSWNVWRNFVWFVWCHIVTTNRAWNRTACFSPQCMSSSFWCIKHNLPSVITVEEQVSYRFFLFFTWRHSAGVWIPYCLSTWRRSSSPFSIAREGLRTWVVYGPKSLMLDQLYHLVGRCCWRNPLHAIIFPIYSPCKTIIFREDRH